MDINKFIDQPEKVCYEVWGNDTFSNETYFVGLYTTNSSANRAMHRHEEDAKKTQDEEVRDTFWITRTTVAEHSEMLRKRDEYNQRTWDMIDKHKAIIDEVWNDFRKLVQAHGGEAGEHSLYLLTSHPDCEITKLTMENRYEYERKRKGAGKYCMYVGIWFKNKWMGARIGGSERFMRCGTLEALSRFTQEEMFFEICHESFYKAIEKYFYGD